jgi:hypothetical protein
MPSVGDADATGDSALVFGRANVAGFGRIWGWPFLAARAGLFVLTLICCLVLLPWVFYTFWIVFETALELGLAPGYGQWPRQAALIFGALTSSGLAYLIQDHVALFGCDRARRMLEEKAGRMLGAASGADGPRFSVTLRPEGRAGSTAASGTAALEGAAEDIGWLILASGRLEYVGDVWRITLPRALVARVRRGPDLARIGLGPGRVPSNAGGRGRGMPAPPVPRRGSAFRDRPGRARSGGRSSRLA